MTSFVDAIELPALSPVGALWMNAMLP